MKEEKNFEYEFIDDFDPSKLDLSSRQGKWIMMLREFEEQPAKTLMFGLHSRKEMLNCRQSIHSYKRAYGKDWTVFTEGSKYRIYVCKA